LTTLQLPKISEAGCIDFVDKTGRILHPGKRGMIDAHEPPALRKLALDMQQWAMHVKGNGFRLLPCGWRGRRINGKSLRDRSKLALPHWICENFLRLKRQLRIKFGALTLWRLDALVKKNSLRICSGYFIWLLIRLFGFWNGSDNFHIVRAQSFSIPAFSMSRRLAPGCRVLAAMLRPNRQSG